MTQFEKAREKKEQLRKSKKGFAIIEYYPSGYELGADKEGLQKLRDQIDSLLKSGQEEVNTFAFNSNIESIVITSEKLPSHSKDVISTPPLKRRMLELAVMPFALVLSIWFTISPLLAIGLIVYIVKNAEPEPQKCSPAWPIRNSTPFKSPFE